MKKIILSLGLTILLFSCQEDELDPTVSFTKIYDSFRSDQNYNPIDIVRTETGFLILAGQSIDDSSFEGVQIIELDDEGNYISEQTLDEEYVTPVGDFITIEGVHYFFMMERTSLTVVMGTLANDVGSLTITPLSNGLTFPLAASTTSNNELLLLSYNLTNAESVLSVLTIDGSLSRSASYTIGAGNDVEEQITNHYIDPERSGLPFQCGQINDNSYYFNGFYNYSLSMVFTNFGSDPTGVIQGQGTNGGVTSLLPITSNSFSLFGFQFNDNFITPTQTVDVNAISSSIDYFTVPFSEYISRSSADMILYTMDNGTEISIIAAETESRQIALNFFDASSGESMGILRIGNINPYSLSSIKVDEENNLMVLGTTLVSGRFSRAFFRNIAKSELEDIIN